MDLVADNLFNGRRIRALTLAGIELVQMIRKVQYQHSAGEDLSSAEQFYLLAA